MVFIQERTIIMHEISINKSSFFIDEKQPLSNLNAVFSACSTKEFLRDGTGRVSFPNLQKQDIETLAITANQSAKNILESIATVCSVVFRSEHENSNELLTIIGFMGDLSRLALDVCDCEQMFVRTAGGVQ